MVWGNSSTFLLLSSVALSISSSSLFMGWVGMELSVLFFLSSLPEKEGGVGSVNYGSIWKYFYVQSVSSLLLFFFVILSWENSSPSHLVSVTAVLASLVKIGVFPFHGWSYHMVGELSWSKFFLLSSFMKLPPLLFISLFYLSDPGVKPFEVLFLANGFVMGFFLQKGLPLKWLVLSSSNYVITWLIFSFLLSKEEASVFVASYFFHLWVVTKLFHGGVGLQHQGGLDLKAKLFGGLSLLALMGMPPFGVFFGKMSVLNSLLECGSEVLGLLLLLMSSMAFPAYLKLTSLFLLKKEGPLSPSPLRSWGAGVFLVSLPALFFFL